MNKMTGGGDKIEFEYKGTKFMFTRSKNESNNSVNYHLYPNADESRTDYCIFIILDKPENMIYLHTITYNDKCFKKIHYEILGNNISHGTFVLKMAMEFIKKISKASGITFVALKYNSFKYCDGVNISIPMMHTLLNGDTWYGKFGFVPKDNMKAKIN
jgi:hypothetical protein